MSASKPLSRDDRRKTILVTGPQSKKTLYGNETPVMKQNMTKAACLAQERQDKVAVHTANSIEILIQLFLDEIEFLRFQLRETGIRMRNFFANHFRSNSKLVHKMMLSLFNKSIDKRFLEYKRDEAVVFNDVPLRSAWKPPKYTFNDVEEVVLQDDLEDGVMQRRAPKWKKLPKRVITARINDELNDFQQLNVPMSMTVDDEDDRFSMPSTRTVMTSEDQMQAIHAQLAMLSKQLMMLQRQNQDPKPSDSRSSSRRENRSNKPASVDSPPASSPSSTSEDEGKGTSVCSPAMSRKTVIDNPSTLTVKMQIKGSSTEGNNIAPMASAPPPPPPPPPPMAYMSLNAPKVTPLIVNKTGSTTSTNSLPGRETVASARPYLTEIANGRNMLKKTNSRSPVSQQNPSRPRRPVTSFEAALRDRFRCFHGDNSFSEHEDENDDDSNWD